MLDRLKNIIGGGAPGAAARPGASAAGAPPKNAPPVTRSSNGLEQFFFTLRDRVGLHLLDFAGASQANVQYITSLGHRLSSEDFVRSIEGIFGGEGDFYENQADPERQSRFQSENLDYEEGMFDGALVWDGLQYLGPELLEPTLAQLHHILRPGAPLLAFFHADEKSDVLPSYQYRIADGKTLTLAPRGTRRRAQFFNNRALERIFANYASVKFFLTRDSLREVLVRR